jgi:hypothetical protein
MLFLSPVILLGASQTSIPGASTLIPLNKANQHLHAAFFLPAWKEHDKCERT